ncbi:MAG: DUF2399 domain-containing protein [Clostridia bacterium]|nr:DUF2399 domain-containing protein [Clostridia bacterium]
MDSNFRCAIYLKTMDVNHLMVGLKNKYESLGTVGGSYILKSPTEDEKKFLGSLFLKDFTKKEMISVSLQKFEKAFDQSAYEGIDLVSLLTCYFEESIMKKKDQLLLIEQNRKAFFKAFNHLNIYDFIISNEEVSGLGYKWMMGLYKENANDLKTILLQLSVLIDLLKDEKWGILPILAAKVSKNPHALDRGENLYKALLYYLCFLHDLAYPRSAEEIATLFALSGIMDDNLNRFVLTYGLKGPKGWIDFYHRNEPLYLSDMNIRDVEILSVSEEVFCFENPAVFTAFILKFKEASAICTGGQLNVTALSILDQLSKNQVKIWYHGDFDPEGLVIADKLLKRVNTLNIFGYSEALYLHSLSHLKVSEKRLNQLQGLRNEKLKAIAHLMKEKKLSGYEEYIVEELLEAIDLIKLMK